MVYFSLVMCSFKSGVHCATEIWVLFFQRMRIVFLAIARDKSSGVVCSIVLDIVEVLPNKHCWDG